MYSRYIHVSKIWYIGSVISPDLSFSTIQISTRGCEISQFPEDRLADGMFDKKNIQILKCFHFQIWWLRSPSRWRDHKSQFRSRLQYGAPGATRDPPAPPSPPRQQRTTTTWVTRPGWPSRTRLTRTPASSSSSSTLPYRALQSKSCSPQWKKTFLRPDLRSRSWWYF